MTVIRSPSSSPRICQKRKKEMVGEFFVNETDGTSASWRRISQGWTSID